MKVTWYDHCTHGEQWQYLEEAVGFTGAECTSFGEVITSGEDFLNIVQTVVGDKVFGTFTIVRATITRIEVLS